MYTGSETVDIVNDRRITDETMLIRKTGYRSLTAYYTRICVSGSTEDTRRLGLNKMIRFFRTGTGIIGLALAAGVFFLAWTGPVYAEEESASVVTDDQPDEVKEELSPGWLITDDGKMYLNKNLQYVTGWQEIEGAWYYFDEDGIMQTGFCDIENKVGTWTYYFSPSGVMMTGWVEVGQNWYYFDAKGRMQTGLKWIENKAGRWRYFFDSLGVMRTGWKQVGDNWFFFRENGSAVTGWMKENGKWYYMNASGVMQTGWKKIDRKWYYFNARGDLHTGWLSDGGYCYYLKETGMQTGWKKINDNYYYFTRTGRLAVDRWLQGKYWYYVDKNGRMKTGWLQYKDHWYYFDTDGSMVADRKLTIGNKTYYLDKQGIMLSGTVIEDGSDLYYIQNDGTVRTEEGWFSENEKVYLIGKDGKLTTEKLAQYNGVYYYLRSTGIGELLRNQTAAKIADSMDCDLAAAMKYAGGLTYQGKDYFTDAWGTKRLANYGFSNSAGNCYVYAAVFAELAYAMGYDAHHVRGSIRLSWGWGNNHSWVEIYKDDQVYVCDPAGLAQLGWSHAYMFHYGDKGTWMYKDPYDIIYE